jgi:NDP-sugar pyrophosphorylase family protein
MAGGFGKRLYPLTNDTPKPMLKIGSKPMLEHIILKLKAYGVKNITISTHYLPEKITEYFGDGSKLEVNIDYVHEDQPLGTGGALALLTKRDKPLLVMNGDILTGLNIRAFHEYHSINSNDISVAARPYDFQIPYGVIQTDQSGQVKNIIEKPVENFLISAGVYILNPSVYADLEKNQVIDLPDIVEQSIKAHQTGNTFFMWKYWLDIGKRVEYDLAQTFISHREAS